MYGMYKVTVIENNIPVKIHKYDSEEKAKRYIEMLKRLLPNRKLKFNIIKEYNS